MAGRWTTSTVESWKNSVEKHLRNRGLDKKVHTVVREEETQQRKFRRGRGVLWLKVFFFLFPAGGEGWRREKDERAPSTLLGYQLRSLLEHYCKFTVSSSRVCCVCVCVWRGKVPLQVCTVLWERRWGDRQTPYLPTLLCTYLCCAR